MEEEMEILPETEDPNAVLFPRQDMIMYPQEYGYLNKISINTLADLPIGWWKLSKIFS